MNDIAAVLLAKKTELEEQMGLVSAQPEEQGSIAFGKRVGDGTSVAVDRMSQVGVHDQLQVTLADVTRALTKLDEGSYGTCDECGKPVGDERLEALPWAVLCVEDAAKS